jgi:hypothetical protein
MPQALITPPNSVTKRDSSKFSPDQLKEAVALEADRRKIIRDFVRAQLEESKDYGTIPVRSKSGLVTQSKPVLFKSGMEKIFSLFNVVSALEKDSETIEMIGKPGVIAYKCVLTRAGQFIGEGRGACDIAEKGRINDAIKIAEKRSRMDACLNLGFSEYFTQDLEDMFESQSDIAVPESLVTEKPSLAVGQDWKHGEVRDMVIMVNSIEMKNSQAGTTYALLHTDQGVIKAWKNTFNRFEPNKQYRVALEASEWNNQISLAVNRFYQEITTNNEE